MNVSTSTGRTALATRVGALWRALHLLILACFWLSIAGVAGLARAATPVGIVTILDGEALLLRGTHLLALAEGVRLYADDILELGPHSRLLQVEFNDGASLSLGPSTRVLLAPRLGAERTKSAPRVYLLHGWLKLRSTGAAGLASAWLDVSATSASAVLTVQSDSARLFAEAGELTLRTWRATPAPSTRLTSGELLSWSGSAKPVLATRPPADFVQSLPKPFLDSLPARAALFRNPEREVQAKPLGEPSYAQLQPWIDAEPVVRRANMARWRPLSRNPQIRRALLANLAAHPEWAPVLLPPPPKPTPPKPPAASEAIQTSPWPSNQPNSRPLPP